MTERDLGRNLAELGADVGIVRVNPQEADPDDIYGVSPLEEGALAGEDGPGGGPGGTAFPVHTFSGPQV